MLKVAVVGDPHISLGTETREDPFSDTLAKLDYISQTCVKQGVHVLIVTGDFFDNMSKYIPTSVYQKIAVCFDRFKVVYFVTGNHDFHKSFNYLWKDEPIGNLFHHCNNMVYLDENPTLIGNYRLFGRSWKKDFDRRAAEDLSCPEGYSPAESVIVCHAYLLPESEQVMGMFINIEDLQNPVNNYIVGHYHKRLDVVKRGEVSALIPGSLTRIKSSEEHIPACFVLDFDSPDLMGSVEVMYIPVRPLNEVFKDVSEDKDISRKNAEISDFVKTLKSDVVVMTRMDFIESFATIASLDFPGDGDKLCAFTNHVLDKNI